jgi:hypothetical protein
MILQLALFADALAASVLGNNFIEGPFTDVAGAGRTEHIMRRIRRVPAATIVALYHVFALHLTAP